MGIGIKNIRKKGMKLRSFFIQYLFALFTGFVLIILTVTGVFFLSLKTGFVISVSDVEASIEQQKPAIMSVETVEAESIPKFCRYALLSSSGEFLSGNLTKSEAITAWKIVRSGRSTSGGYLKLDVTCYFPIVRENQICILAYSSLSQYRVPLLQKYLPCPEIMLFWFILMAFLLEILLLSRLYGRKISHRLLPLQSATEKIREKDLTFEIQYSGIDEIDAALQSLNSMKTDLELSLEKQWKMEQTRKTQISALAHDLKTPITVIRGNAEMLCDTELTQEQKDYTRYISKNVSQMEQYVQMLIDISKADTGYPLQLNKINLRVFLEDLYMQIKAIAAVKQIELEFEEKALPEFLCVDISLFQRAIINVVSNAVDYSPEQGTILFSTEGAYDKITFTITDSGKGFSFEALNNATSQFYQGDLSRSSKAHYGLGLFIADSIVKQHDGTLIITNSPATGGGMVSLEMKIK